MATLRRLFVQRPNDTHPGVSPADAPIHLALDREEQHYARDVLRLQVGDAVTVIDGTGMQAEAVLTAETAKVWGVTLTAPMALSPALEGAPRVILACPLPKGERADWLAEKMAELGLYAWVWVVCARSVVLPKGANKTDRLVRLMRAAARQARHGRVPQLLGPVALTDHLATVHEGPASSRFVADGQGLAASAVQIRGLSTTRHLLVGPEGGLTPDELQQAAAAGYGAVALGPHVLRVETAAMAAVVLMGQADSSSA